MHPDQHSEDLPPLLLREKRAIERAQAGELAAIEPVLAQHAEALFMCLLGWVGERATAEELLQDTFVTALERLSSFRLEERSIYPWLRQLALQRALDHHRQSGRRKRLCEALRRELTESSEAAEPAAMSADGERRLAQQRLDALLDKLPPRYAQAIRLRLSEERPRLECAATLGLSGEAFDVLLFRALRAFRHAYGEPDASR